MAIHTPIHTSDDILRFYAGKLGAHGDSAQGVGWKNDEAQEVRFRQLIKVIQDMHSFSINDLGCGTAKLYSFLVKNGLPPSLYKGYDILDEMIEASRKNVGNVNGVKLIKIKSAADMELSDYSVASGIFNVKYEASESEWLYYILSTIDSMNKFSKVGFSFNLLTKYSDKEFMQAYLYYADPLFFFDYCKRNFSKNVALLHDYDQYDFTIIVRKS